MGGMGAIARVVDAVSPMAGDCHSGWNHQWRR